MFKENKKLKFSIRKFTIGVGSVAIGALLLIGSHASAEESYLADGVTPTSVREATSEATYAISGVWNLSDEYVDNDLVVEDVAASKGYAKATTTIVREDGTVVNVAASIKPVDGNPEGIGYLANGADQSKYGATAAMLAGNPDPSAIPALGILTQPSETEGGGDLRDKLNFNGKEASTILTLTFDQEVTNPIIDLSGVGGNSRMRFVTGYSRGSFNATYFELLTQNVTLEKASEGVNLTVTGTSIEVTDKNAFHRSVVDPTYSGFNDDSNRMPNVSPAGTGSIRLKGTFKEVQFKLYHESTPFTAFPTDEYETGTSYFINTSTTSNPAYSIGSDKINGNNKHYNDYIDYRGSANNETTNSDLLRFSLRLENTTEKTGSVIVNYVDTDGNVIGTEYKDLTDVAVGTAYNTAETADDVASTATKERPATITKDGKTYELVAEETDAKVGKVNDDGSLASNNAGFTFGTDAASGQVAEGTKYVTYVYKEVVKKGSVNARYVIEGTETEIADDKSVKTDAPIDEAYQDEAPAEITKDGVTYELVRTRTKDGDAPAAGAVKEGTQTITYEYKVKPTPETPKGDVIVHYVDESGNVIKSPVTDTPTSDVKTPYDTTDNRPSTIEFNGKTYELVPTKTIGQETGEVVKGTTEITYVYKLKEEPKGSVNAHYVIVDTDTKLAADKVVKTDAPVGEEYSDKAPASLEKDGKRYELVGTRTNDGDAPAEGTVKEGTQDITYEYTEVPKGRVIVDYVIQGTDTKLQDTYTDTPTAYIRDKNGNAVPYNTAENGTEKPTVIEKDGVKYELVGVKAGSDAEEGTLREGEQHVIYEYRKVEEPVVKQGSVVVDYVDSEGNKIGTSYTDTDNKAAGTAYDTTVNTGTVDAASTTERPSVITKDGKTYRLVATDKTLSVGDVNADGSLKTDAKNVNLGTDAATGTVEGDTTKRVTYVYEEVKGSVKARYVIQGTEEELKNGTDVVTDASLNEPYSDTPPATITKDGKTYVLAPVPVRTKDGDAPQSGTVKEGTQTIVYEYVEKKEEVKTGSVNAHYVIVDTDTKLAADKVVKTDVPVGEEYSDKAPASIEKDGKRYEFVGTRQNTGDAPAEGTVKEGTQDITYEYTEVPKGSVIVDYVIQGTDTKLQDTYTDTPTAYIRDKEGNAIPYNTAENGTEKPTIIEKDGVKYELVGVKAGSDAEQGTLREGEQHVIYEYHKVEEPVVKQGNVVVTYVSEDGTPISGTTTGLPNKPSVATKEEDTTLSPIDTPYNTTDLKPTTITTADGVVYQFVKTSDTSAPEEGKVAEGTTTVAYVYRRVPVETTEEVKTEVKGNVVVHYVTAEGTVLQSPVEDTPSTVVSTTVTTIKKVDGVVVSSTSVTTPSGAKYNTADDHKPAEITVNGKTYVLVGTAVEDSNGNTQLIDGKVKTAPSTDEEEGDVKEGTTNVTYVYKLKEDDTKKPAEKPNPDDTNKKGETPAPEPSEPADNSSKEPQTGNEPVTDTAAKPASKRVLPSTGEVQSGLALVGIGLILAGIAVVVRKRRKH